MKLVFIVIHMLKKCCIIMCDYYKSTQTMKKYSEKQDDGQKIIVKIKNKKLLYFVTKTYKHTKKTKTLKDPLLMNPDVLATTETESRQ